MYYSLLAREIENELIPLSLDQKVGILVWSPLSFGILSEKYRRNGKKTENTRLAHMAPPGQVDWERAYDIIDVIADIAENRGKTIVQVALNWLLQRPGISSLILGARNETQLRENLGAIGWKLTEKEIKTLGKSSEMPENYPYWHQHKWGSNRNPTL